jgi:Flp pilus assembly protein CpaB
MQSRTPILMIIALICGLGAAFGTWKVLSGAPAPTEQKVEEVEVLVPKKEIPGMTGLRPELFEPKKWPKRDLTNEEYITPADDLKEFKTRNYALKAGKPFYRADIVKGQDFGFTQKLKANEVAYTVPTDAASGMSGFLQVGHKIDICVVMPAIGPEGPTSQTVLQNVEVLAVNGPIMNDQQQMIFPERVILRLTRDQMESIAMYKTQGQMSLALRNQESNDVFETTGTKRIKAKAIAQDRMVVNKPDENPRPAPPPVTPPVDNKQASTQAEPEGPTEFPQTFFIGKERDTKIFKLPPAPKKNGNSNSAPRPADPPKDNTKDDTRTDSLSDEKASKPAASRPG